MLINVNKLLRIISGNAEKILAVSTISLSIIALIWGISLYSKYQQINNLDRLNAGKPNVMIINIDSLRADHMGIYGYDKDTTPFLDSLFGKGIIFDQAVSPAYLTFQTDGSILSSLYPSQHNAIDWQNPLRNDVYYLPQILKLYSYKTAAFVSPSLWKSFEFDKLFDEYKLNGNIKNIYQVRTELKSWIVRQKEPFFLYWHIYDVHSPYIKPSPQFFKQNYNGELTHFNAKWIWEKQKPGVFYRKLTANDKPQRQPGNEYQLTSMDKDYLKASYDSGIKYVDEQLNIFFDLIKDNPFLQNTIIIISSEHGEDLGEHGFFFHRDLYDANTHVPLAIIYPKFKPQRIKEAVSLLDIMPTLISIIGDIPHPENIEGENLMPLINGGSYRREIFSERAPFDEYSVRSDKWKYILRNPKKQEKDYDGHEPLPFMNDIVSADNTFSDELYDLENDKDEQKNIIGNGLEIESKLKTDILNFRSRMSAARQALKDIPEIKADKILTYP